MAALPGEGEEYVPPRKHTRKLVARLERLRALEPPDLDAWRLRSGGQRAAYAEAYDKLLGEDIPRLLDGLLGREEGWDDDPDYADE